MVNIRVCFNTGSTDMIDYFDEHFIDINLPYLPRIGETVSISEETVSLFQEWLVNNTNKVYEYFPKWFNIGDRASKYNENLNKYLSFEDAICVVEIVYRENKEEVLVILDKERPGSH